MAAGIETPWRGIGRAGWPFTRRGSASRGTRPGRGPGDRRAGPLLPTRDAV